MQWATAAEPKQIRAGFNDPRVFAAAIFHFSHAAGGLFLASTYYIKMNTTEARRSRVSGVGLKNFPGK